MTVRHIIFPAAAAILMAVVMQSCFTGVESTPRITERDITRRNVVVSAEEKFLSDIHPQMPSHWMSGKKFYVTDNRISLIFTPGVNGATQNVPDSLAGTLLNLDNVAYGTGVTGADEVRLTFTDHAGRKLVYLPGISRKSFAADSAFQIPFTVDMDIVRNVSRRLSGNTYWLLTPRRFHEDGHESAGLRYVPVTIMDVVPGNDVNPLRVRFTEKDAADTLSVFITVGSGRRATRNFNKLFSFANPRDRYPAITDKTWNDIMHSQISTGMTPDECRLALGAPDEYLHIPTTAGMVERWTYGDGTYLFFEDGVLARFRR
ncbi:MAG: hypothetical protein Q4F07_01115 [Bacteroidales bacterium]|nr:hypothetical protein [Bacteroidales bacterium]